MSHRHTRPTRAAIARLVLALVGLTVGVSSLLVARRLLDERASALDLLVETGLSDRRPEIASELERETDPVRAGLLLARALLSDAVERLHRADVPVDPMIVDDVARQLAAARTLAEEARSRRPAAWQAHMIAGATTYLEWTLRRDRRVATEATRWETPLRTAIELAPTQAEPKRFLTMAYLELWPMLSPEKRELARGLVATTFENPRMLARLLPPWLDLTANVDEALEAIPDDSRAWLVVESHFARNAEWEELIRARRRALDALRRECEARLAEASHLRGRHAARRSRELLLPVITSLPVEASWGELLARTLERLPAGLPGKAASARLRQWLEWNLEGCALSRCRLPPRAAARLAVLAGDLPLPLRARSALAADDLASAETFERRADRIESEPWAAYLIEKVPHLLRRGEIAQATAALDAVHGSQRSTLPFLHAARALAEASEDEEALAAADFALARRARLTWTAADWAPPEQGDRQQRYRLALELATVARGLELLVESAPAQGAVSELRIDGAAVAVEIVGVESRRLSLESTIEPGPHLVELESVAGGAVVPGPGRLLAGPR